MSGGGLNVPPKEGEAAKPATPMNKFFSYNPTLKEAEAETKKVMDWAGRTDRSGEAAQGFDGDSLPDVQHL